mmetsp:Transcript_23378/g.43484  ORF Transcript_23378/g.43484 Transcript_23378/m.43484 type:complete len:360 (+) Transcript_23378:154-1233(+)
MMSVFNADECSICKTTEDALDNLTGAQLLINHCGHKFCKSCTDRKFSQKSSFVCPVCGSSIKRNTISEKTLDEIEASEDVKVRRRINDIYNKEERDFSTLLEYNDYQEEKEDIIYQIVHNIDRTAAEARVKAYQKSHVDEIRTRLTQHSESDREMSQRVQRQRADNQAAVQEVQALDVLSRKVEKERRRQELQIRLGERTALSDELVAKQKEIAAQKHLSNPKNVANYGKGDRAPPAEKRLLSTFMQASATGLGGPDQGSSSSLLEPPSASTAPVVVPKVVEQFLQQRPLPKFIPQAPLQVPEDREAANAFFRGRREAGGFDPLTSFRKNYMEALDQLQLVACSATVSGEVRWPYPFGK